MILMKVLGATNRPQDIDPAFLRRLPLRFEVPLPTLQQRKKILQIVQMKLILAPQGHLSGVPISH